jgi:hypothetical protein
MQAVGIQCCRSLIVSSLAHRSRVAVGVSTLPDSIHAHELRSQQAQSKVPRQLPCQGDSYWNFEVDPAQVPCIPQISEQGILHDQVW